MPPLTPANAAIRAENVTASEVGALLGPHPYTDATAIYDRLMGEPEIRKATEAMDTGSFMEHAILRLAEHRLQLKARANSRTFVHPRVRLCATPDAFVIGQPPGLIEIKLSGRPDIWSSVPDHVEWQVRAQMACSNRQTAAVCVLLGGGLRTFLLERDPDLEARLLNAVETFWTEHIVARVRPAPAVLAATFSFDADGAIPEKESIA